MRNLLKRMPVGMLALILSSALFSFKAHAFDNIYIFGDSLSDTGNLNLINNQIPARFSNGPVAVDYLAQAYGLEATPSGFLAGLNIGNNYAVGGAKAVDADGDENTPDTNLPTQVNAYLAANNFQADPDALYVVVIGGNDLFAAQQIRAGVVTAGSISERIAIRQQARQSVTAAVESAAEQIGKLIATGAQHIIVGNAPDIGAVPATDKLVDTLLASSGNFAQKARAKFMYRASSNLSALWNFSIALAVGELESTFGVDIIEWDLAGFLAMQIEGGADLGFSNVEDACLDKVGTGECDPFSPPTGFVFFDDVHPTTSVHANAGNDILQLLNQ